LRLTKGVGGKGKIRKKRSVIILRIRLPRGSSSPFALALFL